MLASQLSPLLHLDHPLPPPLVADSNEVQHQPGRLRRPPKGVSFRPAEGGQFSRGADSRGGSAEIADVHNHVLSGFEHLTRQSVAAKRACERPLGLMRQPPQSRHFGQVASRRQVNDLRRSISRGGNRGVTSRGRAGRPMRVRQSRYLVSSCEPATGVLVRDVAVRTWLSE
jgi:hypothetical protein